MTTANEKLLRDAVAHAVAMERFKNATAAQVAAYVSRYVVPRMAAAAKGMRKEGARYTKSTIEAAVIAARKAASAGVDEVAKRLGATVVRQASAEASIAAGYVANATGMRLAVGAAAAPPNLGAALFDHPLVRRWFAALKSGTQRAVERAIRAGAAANEQPDQIARRILGDKSAGRAFGGVAAKARRDAESVARTVIAFSGTRAREAAYASNADVIRGVRIVATLDERTTLVCMGQDGKVYPLNEGPRPPFHFNCRTVTAPVTKSWAEIMAAAKGDPTKFPPQAPKGSRASMRGEVPASLTYAEWLRTQPASFQDEVLGTRRAELFRSGLVQLDRFVDASGKSLSITELERMAELASRAPPPGAV